MKNLIKIFVLVIIVSSVVSCQKDSRPNYQYFPNMYEAVPYETYGESAAFNNGVVAQLPVEGTIPRGFAPFDFDESNEDFQLAKATLLNPLTESEIDTPRAKQLYDIYCGICHGNKGDGQGNLVKREKILGIPSFADAGRAITEGSIYHTIYYGKNAMGSYANQLNDEERWQVVAYVLKLKADLEK